MTTLRHKIRSLRSLILLPLFIVCISSVGLIAQSTSIGTLTIEVRGIRNAKGMIGVALFDSAKGFPKSPQATTRREFVAIDPSTGTAHVTFKDLPYGIYAVSVFHDENGNRVLDEGLFGIPKEGFGFSNDAVAHMKPPSFSDAQFPISRMETQQTITLHYR